MKIGLTYDLRQDYLAEGYSEEETAEFDRPDTIESIESALKSLSHQTDRIGSGKRLIERLTRGDRWDLVFNIAEGLHGTAREAQVPAILDLFQIPYTFSDPLTMTIALHKHLTKTIVRQAGVPTADFALVERMEDVDKVDLTPPLFVKPAAEGTSKGISAASKIANRQALRRACDVLLKQFRQPVLVETFLPGREFTVGMAGTGDRAEVLGTLEVILHPHAEADVYSYRNKEECEDLVHYKLVRAENDDQVRRSEEIALHGLADFGMPRRGPDRFALRRPRPRELYRGQSPARTPPPALRSADFMHFAGNSLCFFNRADRTISFAKNKTHASCGSL